MNLSFSKHISVFLFRVNFIGMHYMYIHYTKARTSDEKYVVLGLCIDSDIIS